MFAFLNDLSIAPDGVMMADNWQVIRQLFNVATELRNYSINKIRVPKNFINMPIAGSRSLAYYAINTKGDDSRLLLGFIANRLDEKVPEIAEVLSRAEQGQAVGLTFHARSSQLLLEAYLMECPALSFRTHPDFETDFVQCDYQILDEYIRMATAPAEIVNIYTDDSFATHRTFLVDWKQKIVFAKTKWKPADQPIWNTHTTQLLQKQKFPLSVAGLRDKKEELLDAGTMVAEFNGWQFDEFVTKKNKNSGVLRKIFRSKNSGNSCYLSIDFEKASGRFEVHDHNGKHIGEIDFEHGRYKENRDDTGAHDIKIN